MVMVVLIMMSSGIQNNICLSHACHSGHVPGVHHAFLYMVPVQHQCSLALALQYYVV